MGHLIQPSCRSRVTYSRLHRTLSRRVLNISREGDSTTPLGSLFQCSITLRGKKFFLIFSWNFLCFSLYPLLSFFPSYHACMVHVQDHTLIWVMGRDDGWSSLASSISSLERSVFPGSKYKKAGTKIYFFIHSFISK